MSIVQLGRLMAVLAVIGVLLAMTLVQQRRRDKLVVSHSMPAEAVTNPLTELIRCKELNAEAATAARCEAVWARSRERFLGYGRAENGTLRDEMAPVPEERGR